MNISLIYVSGLLILKPSKNILSDFTETIEGNDIGNVKFSISNKNPAIPQQNFN